MSVALPASVNGLTSPIHPLNGINDGGLPTTTNPPPPTPSGKGAKPHKHSHPRTHPHAQPPPPLPHEFTGLIPFREVISRLVQRAYEDLNNLAEILPAQKDYPRRRAILEYGNHTRKQVVKALVLARWAKVAPQLQQCQDIRAFLQFQNAQFKEAVHYYMLMRNHLVLARSRQYDITTALEVLTTGTYLRLPKIIKRWFIPDPPLTNPQAITILHSMDTVLRHRLRMHEHIPLELSRYHIADGRVYFTAPNLFSATFTTGGAEPTSQWFLLSLEFLISIKDQSKIFYDRFPRIPEGALRTHIIAYTDTQLALRATTHPRPAVPPPPTKPSRKKPRKIPPIDAPFVRAFNFLQMFSLTYQLEILHYQALQLIRRFAWGQYLRINFSRDRRTLTASYWMKDRPPPPRGHPPWPPSQSKTFGGTLTISLESKPLHGRTALGKVLTDLDTRSKLGLGLGAGVGVGVGAGGRKGKQAAGGVGPVRLTDEVEGMRLRVMSDPAGTVLGVELGEDFGKEEFDIDASDLDFEAILSSIIVKHANALMRVFYNRTRTGAGSRIFTDEELQLVPGETGVLEIQAKMRGDETVLVHLDIRSGAFIVREAGVFPSTARDVSIHTLSGNINSQPGIFSDALCSTRLNGVLDDAERKAGYLDTKVYRTRHILLPELAKFGPGARIYLYIALASFDTHYLVIVLADQGIRYALIKVEVRKEDVSPECRILECAWLDVRKVSDLPVGGSRRFTVDSETLRNLYAYCRARVSHTELEQQLRNVQIDFEPIFAHNGAAQADISTQPAFPFISSMVQNSVPTICVASASFLRAMSSDASTMSADAWCSNIAFRPVDWWSSGTPGVVVSLKLRPGFFVPLSSDNSTSGEYAGVRVRLDSATGVITFHLANVHGAIIAFVKAWEGVSKAVSVAREVRAMSEEPRYAGVRLLSFTLSSVSLIYHSSFAITITSSNSTSLIFSRHGEADGERNPHEDGVVQYSRLFEEGGPRKLIEVLRDTLPLILEVDSVVKGRNVEWFLRDPGWFRVLYGDSRYALDFRLLKGSRVLVVDGSVCLFDPVRQSQGLDTAADAGGKSPSRYTPIPSFPTILHDVLKQIIADRKGARRSREVRTPDVVVADEGMLCQQPVVRPVVQAVHAAMMKLLEAESEQ